jgi:hypothetical protein
MGIYSQLFPQPLRTLLDTAHVVSGLLFDEILLSFWAMCHLEAEILFKDGLDVLGAHFQRHHAREEWASRVIVSIFDLFVNKHIPDIGSLRIAAEEEKERKESIREDDRVRQQTSWASLRTLLDHDHNAPIQIPLWRIARWPDER